MAIADNSEMQALTGRFFAMLRSLDEFNEKELRGILMNQLRPTVREQCFLGNYLRTIANVKTLLKLTSVKDCQAVAMIARSIFETAIEIALIDKINQGPEKIIAFSDLERLKRARKIVQFAQQRPSKKHDLDLPLHTSFIEKDGPRIDAKRSELWPDKKQKLSHWSQKNLRSCAEIAGDRLLEIYDSEYQVHSWYTHAGITGVLNTDEKFYLAVCANAFRLSAESFEIILESMISTFQLYRTDQKLQDKLSYAKCVSFANDSSQAAALWNEMVG